MTILLDIVWVLLAIGILWKTADWFVEGAVGIAEKMGVPPMLVGLVLMSLATTAPELMASLLAAIEGNPEVALGNAVGSVIIDASLALGLAALVATSPLVADPKLLRVSGTFLVGVMFLAFGMTYDGTLTRYEGGILVFLFGCYLAYSARMQILDRKAADVPSTHDAEKDNELREVEAHLAEMSNARIIALFVGGLTGVLIGAKLLLVGGVGLAEAYGLPKVIIGLTVVAIGTSVPEVATAVASARKGKSSVGVGNIIGADILNICWVAGLSAVANPLEAPRPIILIMFTSMIIIVLTMLVMLRWNYKLSRLNGAVLVTLYVVYALVLFFGAPRDALNSVLH